MYPYKLIIFSFVSLLLSCRKEEVPTLAKVSTFEANDIKITSVKISGEIIESSKSKIIEKGFLYSVINSNPTEADSKITVSSEKLNFEIVLENLSPNTRYYFRSFVKSTAGISLGNVNQFTTLDFTIPLVQTESVLNISYYSAEVIASISSDGGSEIKEKGFCISLNSNPTIKDMKFIVGNGGLGSFKLKLENLKENTKYFIRSYVVNIKGETYGNEILLITLPTKAPVITTNMPTEIAKTAFISGGNIIDSGGLDILEKGICFSFSPNPTVNDNKIIHGSGAEPYYLRISDLRINSIIYVRAFAKNTKGINYGEEFKVTLIRTPALSIVTEPVQQIGYNYATLSAKITDDGDEKIEEFGFCFSKTPNPTIQDNKISNLYLSDFKFTARYFPEDNKFEENTKYYLRSFASNSKGRVYGNELTFTTPPRYILFQGGYLYYTLQPGDNGYDPNKEHGYIAYIEDQGDFKWGCQDINIVGSEGTEIGTGQKNTNDIIKDCTENNIAAKACASLDKNGYDDWYLPSLEEMKWLVRNRFVVKGLFENGNTTYWTSSEINALTALSVSFSWNGLKSATSYKSASIKVRAIRQF